MKLNEIKTEIEKYQYFEDTNIIDISLASIVATRLELGDPIWLVIIGASSGGKSQILRPLALTDEKFLHRVDDLTENTFLSGMNLGAGNGSPSLLHRIGKKGMIVISDLTVLFSKASENKATILSQFRMLYDGEMNKFAGTSATPITWKGYLGIIAGSTPTIYSHFEEVADMGERFIYYRMKDYNPEKATRLAMGRKLYGKQLDDKLSELYADYIKDVVKGAGTEPIELSDPVKDRILSIAQFAERVRTPVHLDFKKSTIDRIPISAMPMRVALQLTSIAKALMVIRKHEDKNALDLTEKDLEIIDHCGWSLANEEKRAALKVLANIQYGTYIKTQIVADKIGLATGVVGNILQNLASVGILIRSGDSGSLSWRINKESDWKIVRRIEKIDEIEEFEDRDITAEEDEDKAMNDTLEGFANEKKMKQNFKLRPLSWSAISSFKFNKEVWYSKYVLGEMTPPNDEMKFGSMIGKRLETEKKFLPMIKRHNKMEYQFKVNFNGIEMVGYADSFCTKTNKKLCEYKTGKNVWNKKRADEHGQITMYLLMNYIQNKVIPDEVEVELFWMPTKKSNKGLQRIITFVEPIEKHIRSFKTKRSMNDVLKFGNEIVSVYKEMEEFAKNHK